MALAYIITIYKRRNSRLIWAIRVKTFLLKKKKEYKPFCLFFPCGIYLPLMPSFPPSTSIYPNFKLSLASLNIQTWSSFSHNHVSLPPWYSTLPQPLFQVPSLSDLSLLLLVFSIMQHFLELNFLFLFFYICWIFAIWINL